MKGCFGVCATLLAATAWGQDGTPVFRATSDLVLLDVQVIHNKTNTAMAQLKARDFELSEDGAPQKIAFFESGQLPLSVVLLFDLTDSVRGVLGRLGAGAQSALDHLKPEDEVAVMVYDASARLVDGFTRDHARTAAAIARAAAMKSDDAAFFNEAVYQAAAQLEKSANPSSRRVILWLTDNLPNVPASFNLRDRDEALGGEPPHTEAEAIRKLHESGTVVMPLLLKDRLGAIWAEMISAGERPYRKKYPPGDAHKYAELTGGFAAGMRGKGVDERLAQVIDSLRSRYTIGYRPAQDKPPGTFCRVNVALAPGAPLRPREWRVLARAGYYRK
ncbi:MAG: VWA domain-containing protein [Candidatus Sulfopaludibacter sp.]|nr:VWA domain-containing protein [Candidatus Sulfopaludibacter sp.]